MQRNSDLFFRSLIMGAIVFFLMFVDAGVSNRIDSKLIKERREIVRILTLTDLCLFTEARYTRHLSMADAHTPFQNHPLALEHFPSGSIMVAPPHLRSSTAR